MPELIGVLVLLFLIVVFLSLNLRIVKEDEVIIVERFGKFNRIIKEVGIYFLIPFVDRPIEHLSLKPRTDSFKDSKNNIMFEFTFQITDPYLYTYAHLDAYKKMKELIVQNHLSNHQMNLEELKSTFISMGVDLMKAKSYNIE
jgi:regulator of protease activity HflC (stomatin/prohibitin superfamily)